MSVELYATTEPAGVELIIDGIKFRTEARHGHEAFALAMRVVKALGLGRTPDQGTVIIDGEAVPTIPEPSEVKP